MEFDFDTWARLAKDDPAEFERRRETLLREAIDNAPPAFRQRLERLQTRLDFERHRSTPSRASSARMNTLLWAGFYRLRKELNGTPAGSTGRDTLPAGSAQIIPLRSRLTEDHTMGPGGGPKG